MGGEEELTEIRTKSSNNVGTFVTKDIQRGRVVLRECPFAKTSDAVLRFHTTPNPTGNAKIDAEIRSLQRVITTAGQTRQAAMLRMEKEGKGSFQDLYPPHVRAALDRMCVYAYQHLFNSLPESTQKKWLSLHDGFQDVPLGMESSVGIFGLKSPKGQQLNGTIGTSLGKKGKDKNEGRFSVRTKRKGDNGNIITEDLWIKKENIKTVYGTCRSNAFSDGLFDKICRINHSCKPNATKLSMAGVNNVLDQQLPPDKRLAPSKPNEFGVLSNREIKAGEELTVSYLGKRIETRSTKTRREELCEKYGFHCECEACQNRTEQLRKLGMCITKLPRPVQTVHWSLHMPTTLSLTASQ